MICSTEITDNCMHLFLHSTSRLCMNVYTTTLLGKILLTKCLLKECLEQCCYILAALHKCSHSISNHTSEILHVIQHKSKANYSDAWQSELTDRIQKTLLCRSLLLSSEQVSSPALYRRKWSRWQAKSACQRWRFAPEQHLQIV